MGLKSKIKKLKTLKNKNRYKIPYLGLLEADIRVNHIKKDFKFIDKNIKINLERLIKDTESNIIKSDKDKVLKDIKKFFINYDSYNYKEKLKLMLKFKIVEKV